MLSDGFPIETVPWVEISIFSSMEQDKQNKMSVERAGIFIRCFT
jgi:hypothetical protein